MGNVDGFVRAGFEWTRCVKNCFISARDLWDAGIKNEVHYKEHPELPFKIETILKEAGKVPKDALLVGYWYPYNMHGFIVRFAHKSFTEVNCAEVVPDEHVDLREFIHGLK